ncbi:MAG TPA: GAF domain-containing protein [Thermoanaerobaculia bacterium]|nr:GAF domain-containing protein [Thermoanaerobaculia bacterium]
MKPPESQRPFIEKITQDNRDYVESLLDDNQRLNRALAELQVELATRQQMEDVLRQRVHAIEEESRGFSARYVEVEQQNTNLANLYVASYQLHGTLDRDRIIEAIKEIVINLIGSEELAIFEAADGRLELAGSFGLDEAEWAAVPFGHGVVGLCGETGVRFLAGEVLQPTGREEKLTACIPLKLDDRVIGAIAIFSLLPQKPGLEPVDLELFDLLASHAASALYCTRIAAEVTT